MTMLMTDDRHQVILKAQLDFCEVNRKLTLITICSYTSKFSTNFTDV